MASKMTVEMDEKKVKLMTGVVQMMVEEEAKLPRRSKSERKLAKKLGDGRFVAWHRARIRWLKRFAMALRKSRAGPARKCRSHLLEYYPVECEGLGISAEENVRVLMGDEIQRKELIQAIKTLNEEGQNISKEEIREMKAARAEVVDGYTKKGERVVKTRQLIDSVFGRMKKAGPYASLAVGKEASWRVIYERYGQL